MFLKLLFLIKYLLDIFNTNVTKNSYLIRFYAESNRIVGENILLNIILFQRTKLFLTFKFKYINIL